MADETGPKTRILSEDEFKAIQQHVIEQAPKGLSEDEFARFAGPVMANAIAVAEHSPKAVEGSAVGRFVSGAWGVLNPVAAVQGVAHAIAHPIDTAAAIGRDMADQGSKAIDEAKAGHYTEAAGHALAAAIPVVGPAAARAGETIASGDVAGGLGQGVGLVAPVVAAPAARAAANTVRSVAPAAAERVAGALEGGAAKRVVDVMAPKVGPNKTRFGNMAEEVAPSLAKMPDGAPWSREGLHEQISQRLEQAVSALDDAANNRLASRPVDTKPILDALQARRDRLTAKPVEGSRTIPAYQGQGVRGARATGDAATTEVTAGPDISTADMRRNDLGYRDTKTGEFASEPPRAARPIGKDVVPSPNDPRVAVIDQAMREIKDLGPVAHYEPLRRIREAYDGPAKAVYSPAVTADYMKAQGSKMGAADVTGVLRESLAKLDPETAAANHDYSLYKRAKDVMDATAEVERTRPKVGRQIMARLTGSVVGAEAGGVPGAAAGFVLGPALDAALSSGVTTKLQSAKIMTKLAHEIRRGNAAGAANLAEQLKKLVTPRMPSKSAARAEAASVAANSPSDSRGQQTPAWQTP